MIIEVILLVVLVGALLYRWITKSFDKWERLGIVHEKPAFPYGTHNFLDGKKHMNEFTTEDYKKYKQEQKLKVHGWFLLGKPVLSINDVDIIKQIQVKDFNSFVDRNEANFARSFNRGAKLDRLWGLSLDAATGDTWKNIRSTFTPIFTSGKMKVMLHFIKETSNFLTDDLAQKAKAGEEFELKESFGKFSLDTLASCAFGVDGQSFTNDESVFVKHAAELFKQGGMVIFAFLMKLIPGTSELLELLNINIMKPKETKYFRDMIVNSMNARKKSKERRNDIIDLMLDCLKEDEPVDKEGEDTDNQFEQDRKFSHSKKGAKCSEDEVVATALVLLIAGYDTTGMTLTYLAYAMSKNPEIQQKLQEEVDQAFEDNNGELPDYNVIQSLPYIDMVLHETLRKFNPVSLNTRSCTQEYRIAGTDLTLKKDDLVSFSVKGLHEDPEHFSHPDDFWPDHFSKEEKAARSPYAFQAFGQGPRSCIGMRFALLEAKVAILTTWRRFSFVPGTKTQEPMVMEPNSTLGYTKGGVWAKVVKRE